MSACLKYIPSKCVAVKKINAQASIQGNTVIYYINNIIQYVAMATTF